MVPKPLVILSGNTVTTWDNWNETDQQDNPPFTFCPQGDFPLADVAWNHNGQVLATCSAVSTDDQLHNTVVLTAAQSGNFLDSLQHNQQWKHRPAGSVASLAFGGKSRYLCIGDTSGAVCLWDLKKKVRVRQFFHNDQASRQVSLDPTDTYVLSLTSQALRSYKLREGTPASTWTTPQGHSNFTTFHTSTLEPNLTAIGTEDGSLLLYDIANLQSSVPLFDLSRRHEGPVTSVAFSYTNEKLLASASSDGTLQFFDRLSGSIIDRLPQSSSGITSISLNTDGFSCAVGTQDGQAVVYDLRHPQSPLAAWNMDGPVRTVRFSPPPKPKASTKSSGATATPATLGKPAPGTGSTDRKEMEELRRDLEKVTATSRPPYQAPPRNHPPPRLSSSPKPSGFFAALQQQQQQQLSALSDDPPTSYTAPAMDDRIIIEGSSSFNYPAAGGPPSLSMAQHQIEQHNQEEHNQEETTNDGPYESSMYDPPPPMETSPYGSPVRGGQEEAPPQHDDYMPPSRSPPSNRTSPAQQSQPSPYSSPSRSRNRQQDTAAATTSHTTSNLPVEEVRDVVRDEVEKLQDDLEESIRNLHMDMIRQFHQQSQEWNNALSSQMAAMDQLREENQRLREENDFLKRHNQQQSQTTSATSQQRKPYGNSMIFGNQDY